MPERILKYGGVKFRNLVPPVKINRFVTNLSRDKRESLFEIASELEGAGLIEILNERAHSTIDKDTIDDQLTSSEELPFKTHGGKRHLED